MLTAEMPTVLATLGTALMGVAIFAPRPRGAPAASPVEETPSAAHRAEETLPTWPAAIDPRAAGSGPAVRILLLDALGDVRSGWSEALLKRACEEETDPAVRAAAERALDYALWSLGRSA